MRIDSLQGQVLGYMPLGTLREETVPDNMDREGFVTYEAELDSEVTGIHDLYFLFYSGQGSQGGYQIGGWQFVGEEEKLQAR